MRSDRAHVLLYQRVLPAYKQGLVGSLVRRFDMCLVHASEARGSEVVDVAEPAFPHRRTWRLYAPGSTSVVWLGGVLLPLFMHPDVVIYEGSAGIVSNYALLAVCRLLGIPAIAWTFGFDPAAGARGDRLSDRMRLWLFSRSDAVVAYWETGARVITSLRPELAGRVFTAPNVVGAELVEPLWSELSSRGRDRTRTERGLPGDGLVILFLGRLVPVKQVDRLLTALAEAESLGADPVTCIIAGDGPARTVLEEQTRDLGLENVRFVGFVPPEDAGRWLYAADVVVVPGRLGLVVTHAAAFGCPTVSLEVSGPFHGEGVEHLVDGVTGRWVDGISGLTELVLAWSRDLGEAGRLRESAREYYEQRLSEERTLAGFAEAMRAAHKSRR